MTFLSSLPESVRHYLIVTGNYWAFTLTDGALRMLVILYFYQLGYSPLSIAMLFLFYEVFGVITNLVGGWLGARIGLNRTMNIGLGLQLVALAMLLVPTTLLSVAWVMIAQAVSGIAKDLNKMSAKSAIKTLVPDNQQGQLYRWVALLTGSKNALKGVGFFLGGALLTLLGFKGAILAMLILLFCVWIFSLIRLPSDMGKSKNKPKFQDIFSKSAAINLLSAARLFLFGARDVWFVVALPIYLATTFAWDHWYVGSFLALWVIAYGVIQSIAPKLMGLKNVSGNQRAVPDGRSAVKWAFLLASVPLVLTLLLNNGKQFEWMLIIGLLVFGFFFAMNSALHSYLIVSYAGSDGVSLDVGFYYMANAMGRLVGTVLSGVLFQLYGLEACLWVSTVFVLFAGVLSFYLPKQQKKAA
ncbi:organoarsenical effux MFS transporter ArsJ [Marinomonas agarivorans]|nr:organoarsenical effux MFS transporter ArsJ [Marinomonas agarivorans]